MITTVSIEEASQITGVAIHTLRFWESKFSPYLHPDRSKGGQRRYCAQDLGTVALVVMLRKEGYSLDGCYRYLQRRAEIFSQ